MRAGGDTCVGRRRARIRFGQIHVALAIVFPDLNFGELRFRTRIG
jgi:hypothetical protein